MFLQAAALARDGCGSYRKLSHSLAPACSVSEPTARRAIVRLRGLGLIEKRCEGGIKLTGLGKKVLTEV